MKVCDNNQTQQCGSHADCPGSWCWPIQVCSNAPSHICLTNGNCTAPGICGNLLANCYSPRGGFVPFTDPVDTVLNKPGTGINQLGRAAAGYSGAPPPVASATVTFKDKEFIDDENFGIPVGLAQVSWSVGSATPPSDLLGFYVESAGSLSGPWQRLNTEPVAWWSHRYTIQGASHNPCVVPQGHPECLSYRVVAVYADGRESTATLATGSPTVTGCLQTPAPPANLRASNGPNFGTSCTARLDWDPSTDATDYYVYRMVLAGAPTPYFYQTQHLTNAETFYIEYGDYSYTPSGGTCEDNSCKNGTGTTCSSVGLQAFYVTARNRNPAPGGGESPRSNLVFWECGHADGVGYASVRPNDDPPNAIASLSGDLPAHDLACWLTDGAGEEAPRVPARPPQTTEPMLRLGAFNPPWQVYDLHTDHLGSVRVTTNITAAGGIVKTLDNFLPFGEEMSAPASFNTHQYTGHERDKATEMDYMLARYYEAGVGRFLSVDPGKLNRKHVLNPQKWNKYAYVLNSGLPPDSLDT